MITSTFSALRRTGSLGLAMAILGAGATATPAPTSGGTLDILAGGIIPIQTIPSVTLTGEKPCFVRAVFFTTGTVPPGTEVDGLLRVYVDGVEAPYSPIFSDNGPIAPPSAPNQANENDSLNFIFIPPVSDDVVLEVEINPAGPGQVCETDFSNNINSTASLEFVCVDTPDLVYSPIDYRPSGGGPNLPDSALIEPGVGDNFIQGMYPSGDWDYRRTDAPSKLWTGNLNGSGSALNASLLADRNMTVPLPDYIYGWVPGSLPYNGQAIGIPGRAGMGNTQAIRHQRTFAHEIGHLFGRSHIGNQTNVYGVDVEHHLAITQSLPRIKDDNLNDVMVPGLLTNQAWVYNVNHNFYVNHPDFQCAPDEEIAYHNDPTLLLGGTWNRNTNDIVLSEVVTFPGGIATETVPLNEANLIFRTFENGQVTGQFGLNINTSTDTCSSEDHDYSDTDSDSWTGELAIAGFGIVIPKEIHPDTIDKVEVVGFDGTVLTELVRSPSKPFIELDAPKVAASLAGENTIVNLNWSVSDADNSQVKHYIRYSPDGERISPLASNVTQSSYSVNMAGLPMLEEGGYFEILATDGLNTTRVITDQVPISQLDAGNNAPVTHILTPDVGNTYLKGATVILHASGWDIEDFGIRGADLVWTSSVDGVIGTGRSTSIADLSVGGHIITVTATDSLGSTAQDTAAITIIDRELPSTLVTQLNLGFGGPGTAVLTVIGGDLSTGTTADVTVTGATPSTNLWAISSDSNTPTPALGGTLIPVPVMTITPAFTDPSGSWTLPAGIVGGGGPATLYVQAAYLDAGQPFGFGITNAVQVDILP